MLNGYLLTYLIALPMIVSGLAIHRKLKDRTALCLIALLTSWTGIGFLACLLWAGLGRVDQDQAALAA